MLFFCTSKTCVIFVEKFIYKLYSWTSSKRPFKIQSQGGRSLLTRGQNAGCFNIETL